MTQEEGISMNVDVSLAAFGSLAGPPRADVTHVRAPTTASVDPTQQRRVTAPPDELLGVVPQGAGGVRSAVAADSPAAQAATAAAQQAQVQSAPQQQAQSPAATVATGVHFDASGQVQAGYSTAGPTTAAPVGAGPSGPAAPLPAGSRSLAGTANP